MDVQREGDRVALDLHRGQERQRPLQVPWCLWFLTAQCVKVRSSVCAKIPEVRGVILVSVSPLHLRR